jgi:transposase
MLNYAPGSAGAASGSGSPARASRPARSSVAHRWVIERTISWLTGYRRLTIRYERKASHFLTFLTLTCYKKLRKAAT